MASSGGGIDPISAIAGGVGDIFKFGTSFVDKSKIKRQGEADAKLGAINLITLRQAEEEKSKRTMIYAGVGLFIVVIALVGLIIYVKKK